MIEARRPEQGERLIGDVVAITWWTRGNEVHLMAQVAGTPETPKGIVFSWVWYPTWSGAEFPAHMDLASDASLTNITDAGRFSGVATDALRFLITFGILLTAEASPLEVDQEKSQAKKGAPKQPNTTAWVTRHIFLSEQQNRRIASPSKEDIENAARDGLSLEEVSVRGYIRRQRHGPGLSLVKEVYVHGFLSHRWVAADKNKRIVVH
jgi:hypothetical protein